MYNNWQDMQVLGSKITRFLASPWLWYGILGFFVVQALWFVFSAAYPMAFDEDFHFGVIQIYAQQWSPFLSGQPAGGDAFGSLATDPSYLFHYLLSLPLRFFALFTDSQAIQVILLRLINVGIVVGALLVLRRVMLRAGASQALTNTSMAIFVLIPIVPQLAAHINYDNLLMLLLAWLCLLVFRLVDGFRDKRVDVPALLTGMALCLFTSVVKYAALPLLLGAVLFVLAMAIMHFRSQPRKLYKSLLGGLRRLSRNARIVCALVFAVGILLFAQRYVVNTVRYHHPVPDCGKVLTVKQCSQYGPWGRDYNLEQSKRADFEPQPGYFAGEWLKGMRHRLFFAVSGAGTAFVNYIELPVPVAAFTVLTLISVLVALLWWRKLFASPYLAFFAVMTLVYIVFLLIDQYGMYKQTSVPVAINGRYLVPVLVLLAVIAGRGIALTLQKFRVPQLKPYLAVLAILLFLQGGGVFTFILRSDDNWYWPNQAVKTVNHAARTIIAPVVIEGDKYRPWH